MTSFGNLCRKQGQVPRTICRSDGTLPKDRRLSGRLGEIPEAHLVKRLRNTSDDG
ncbi:MAG TPA: hypothetical protein VK626_09415 [Nitrospiraceae bacterium]|nr:hypothetical protein [Nitrospiraceae bacterium]